MKASLLITIIIVVISGNPAALALGKELIYIGVFVALLLYWLAKKPITTRNDFAILVFFSALVCLHLFEFGLFVFKADAGFLTMLGIAFLTVSLVPQFRLQYVKVMYGLAWISLVFYLPTQLGIDLAGMLSFTRIPIENSAVTHIGIHNFHTPEEVRNSGMFWEPGAFAGYLVLALLFLLTSDEVAQDRFKPIVLTVALITTQSTTGYVALFLLVAIYLNRKYPLKGHPLRWAVASIAFTILIGLSYAAYNTIPFLREKIISQMENARIGAHGYRINRFGNLLYDMDFIAERPLVGWSMQPNTRLDLDPEVAELLASQGNGLSGFAVRFGLPALAIYLWLTFRGMRARSGNTVSAFLATFAVAAALMGEQFLNFPLFATLMFLGGRSALPQYVYSKPA